MMRVLHRNRLHFETKLPGQLDNFPGVIVGEKHIAPDPREQGEQSAMVNLPVHIEPASCDGVGRINEEHGVIDVGVAADDLDTVSSDEGKAMPYLRNLTDSSGERLGVPTRVQPSTVLTGFHQSRSRSHD